MKPDDDDDIQIFTDLMDDAMGVDQANITNRMILFLFIKNLYNTDMGRRVDDKYSSWFIQISSPQLVKNYDRLEYNEEQETSKINQIVDSSRAVSGAAEIKHIK